MTTSPIRIRGAAALVTGALLIAACGSGDDDTAAAPDTTAAPETTTAPETTAAPTTIERMTRR